MGVNKADIMARLQREILPLQGYHAASRRLSSVDLGPVNAAFPGGCFPVGAVHEFLAFRPEDNAATAGFISGITSSLIRNTGVIVWISAYAHLYAPGFVPFGIQPDRIIFIHPQKPKDRLWAMEEALRCEGLSAVVCETEDLAFTESRRFQLAVEQSRVTGFVVRRDARKLSTTACIARWKISSIATETEDDLPGIGFPRWKVELLRVRNGKSGVWDLEWAGKKFQPVMYPTTEQHELLKMLRRRPSVVTQPCEAEIGSRPVE